MIEWAALEHAYGTSVDVPALLAAAENSGEESGPAWNELWSRLCHQGTVYTASYAALPILSEMAQRRAPAGYIASLDLAAAIVASTDGPADSVVVRDENAGVIARLRDLAAANLSLADGDVEFVYALQALMAFEDGGVWQRQLTHVADGELPFDCPRCGEFLVLRLDESEPTLANDSDASATPTHVLPADPDKEAVVARMIALCEVGGHPEVASHIQYACGRATCPSCALAFEIPDALT